MSDKIFRSLLLVSALILLLIFAGMFFSLSKGAVPAFREFGFFGFIFSDKWISGTGQSTEQYGALAFIAGTLMTSVLALLICLPFSLPVAFFVGEYFRGKKVAGILGGIVDLLAGIPSIVYGLWGFYALRPLIQSLGLSEQGFGVLTSSLVLAIMIIPYAASLSAEFIRMVPQELKEGAYSLGATRAEVIRNIIFPTSFSGIFSAYVLALGRAIGETMAVTMLIGNTSRIPRGLMDTGNTMASIIANQFGEADGLKLSSLIAIGLLLFLITAIVNFLGRLMIKRHSV
ncbi:MAG: Phosphate transport system permease protein PstC [Bacteroidetes bacterium ADurb.Bin090]|nr:MAG: Phosphate transport system permease protein PstC [Bacteroidetes bacterium ADurb.Bin090]